MASIKKWTRMLLAGVLCCAMVFSIGACASEKKDVHEHSYGEWVVVEEENCQGHKERICACGEKEKEPMEAGLPEHAEIMSKLHKADYGDDYVKLLSVYQEVLTHVEERECDMLTDTAMDAFVEYLLNGKWTNEDGKYISYTYVYYDYENTYGGAWLGHNFPSSMVSGNNYTYYTDIKDGKLVIGYEDTITEERTDNYVITFEKDHISVENLIDKKTYVMQQDPDYTKVAKDNAKYAYFCLAKNINTFKDPSAVKVTGCYVDYEDHVVYAVIESTNSYGGIVKTDYKMYESEGRYYIEEYNHNYNNTNINLEELNTKIKELVK